MRKRIRCVSGIAIIALLITTHLSAQQNLQSLFDQLKPPTQIQPHPIAQPQPGYSPHLSQFFQSKNKYKSFYPNLNRCNSTNRLENYPDTLIVGVAPYLTLTINGSLTHNGPIYVVENGILTISHATVTNLGDLVVFNNGQVIIDSSNISFPQDYFYQRSLTLVNHANVTISNTTLSYGGFSHNCQVVDTAVLTLDNVTQPDWMTTGMGNRGIININGTNQAGEFIIMDYVTLNIKNASNAILWHQFPDTAVINWSFGNSDTAYGYQFNNTKPGVRGIEYNVNADSVYNVGWSMMPCSSSNVNITNSKIRSIGLWFNNPHDSVMVSGITDNASYTNFTAPLSDRTLTFTNCKVQTWSFYVFFKSIINVTGCIAGEIGTENSSKMYGTNYVVDGSGGYHWSSDTSTIFANNATVYTTVRSEKSSIFVFGYGTAAGSGAEAIDNSLLVVVQSIVPADPQALNGASTEFDNINLPPNLYADSLAPISGSAWIHRGPTSNWMYFKNWQLFYHQIDSVNWIPVSSIDTIPVSNSLIANWNTHGLASGNYELDLRITDTWNNKVDAIRAVTLLPFVLGTQQLSTSSLVSLYPNPASENLNISFTTPKQENVNVELDNIIGQSLLSKGYNLETGKNIINLNVSSLSAGTYICRITTGWGSIQKLVVLTGK